MFLLRYGTKKTIICLLKVTRFQPVPSSKGQAYHHTLWSEPSYYRTFRLGGLSTLTDYHVDISVTGGLVGKHEAVCLLRSLVLTHFLLWVWDIAVAFRAQTGTTLRTICRARGGNEVPLNVWMHIRTIETGGAQAAAVVLYTECVHHAYLMFMSDSSFMAMFDCLKSWRMKLN